MPNPKSRSSAAAAPSIEDIRRRARHRLIGAAVLVLVGVIGFPLLFDTQPRPIAVDIPIEIPSRQNAPALVPAPGVEAKSEARPVVRPDPVIEAKPEAKPEVKPDPKLEPRPEPKAEAKPEPKPEPKAAAAPKPAADSQRAQALLEGKGDERVVVQVGAYAEEARAREVRQRLERAGLKTYTHVAKTAEGQRIRVRLGPYETKAEAEKAAAKVKALGLPTAILTL